jgi:hypothetical protein
MLENGLGGPLLPGGLRPAAGTAEPGAGHNANRSQGGDATSGGWGCQGESGRIEASGRPGAADQPLGPDYSSVGLGTGRSSKHGFVASSAERIRRMTAGCSMAFFTPQPRKDEPVAKLEPKPEPKVEAPRDPLHHLRPHPPDGWRSR